MMTRAVRTIVGVALAAAALSSALAVRSAGAEHSAAGACDHAAAARLAGSARSLGRHGAFRDAIAAYVAASNALVTCPASDRAGRIDAYVNAARAVIAGATLAAESPRDAAAEARLVSRATALRAQVNLEGADPAQLSAVQEADGWVEVARALPHGPLPPRR
jgi:hypothetical protein